MAKRPTPPKRITKRMTIDDRLEHKKIYSKEDVNAQQIKVINFVTKAKSKLPQLAKPQLVELEKQLLTLNSKALNKLNLNNFVSKFKKKNNKL
jgi:hypothetical protein